MIFKKIIVFVGLKCSGKHNSVAVLVTDLEI